MLQSEPGRLNPCVNIGDYSPFICVHHSDLINRRHRDIETLLICAEHPVRARAWQRHQRVQPAAAKTAERINHGNTCLTVERNQEIRIKVNGWSPVQTWLQKRLNFFAALTGLRDLALLASIDPCARSQVSNRLANVCVMDLEVERCRGARHQVARLPRGW